MDNRHLSISEKVRQLFLLDNDRYKCTISPGCKYNPKALVITNCLRHVRETHPDSFNVLELGKKVPEEEIGHVRGKKRSRSDEEYATVRVSKQRFMGGLVKLFTTHGVPFRAMEWEGFLDIVQPFLDAFKLKINKQNIVDHIKTVSSSMDTLIKEELKDQVVSMKLDTTSKMNRSVLGVSVQRYNELKLERRSLGNFIHIFLSHLSSTCIIPFVN